LKKIVINCDNCKNEITKFIEYDDKIHICYNCLADLFKKNIQQKISSATILSWIKITNEISDEIKNEESCKL